MPRVAVYDLDEKCESVETRRSESRCDPQAQMTLLPFLLSQMALHIYSDMPASDRTQHPAVFAFFTASCSLLGRNKEYHELPVILSVLLNRVLVCHSLQRRGLKRLVQWE